jgi:hypothetical protein
MAIEFVALFVLLLAPAFRVAVSQPGALPYRHDISYHPLALPMQTKVCTVYYTVCMHEME